MTDKQIIIDGCDVSGCEWIREVGLDSEYICTCNSPNKISGYCKYNPNCYYKQLKAKEQECEELKKIINEAKNSKLDLKSFLVGEAVQNEYEQQLDQLKAELTRANYQIADDEILQCDMREAIEGLKAENDELKKQLMQKSEVDMFFNTPIEGWSNDPCGICRYKQTLTEIKEVLQFYNNTTIGVDKGNGVFELEVSNDNVGKLIYCYDTNPAKEALQKISEVLE